ncbi:MAG: thermonuclease family protein [Leptolyngbyaceae cyanobacterium MO_188.B28]|nr:thermonuclease family protein [Leptolyngbyaceae cyanobacterium MO_188.B28]
MTGQERIKFHIEQVKDGDTIVATHKGATENIRLYGVDCPELAQAPYGKTSRQRLQKLLEPYEEIEVIEVDRDRYGRLVGEVWVSDGCINTQMLCEGHAVAYVRHLRNAYRRRYLDAEAIARRAKLQFWKQPNPMMPWEYRRLNPRRA